MGRPEMKKWAEKLRNKYVRVAIIGLVAFVVVWIMKGIGMALFVLAAVVVVLAYFMFDPRIKRHW
jgi:uncharacterized membrane protein